MPFCWLCNMESLEVSDRAKGETCSAPLELSQEFQEIYPPKLVLKVQTGPQTGVGSKSKPAFRLIADLPHPLFAP